MTLGEIIASYRQEHGMSQRRFAALSGLSPGYISMLEHNQNPKTGQPMIPSLATIKQVADVMGLTMDEIVRQLGDSLIDIGYSGTTEEDPIESRISELVHQLPEDLKLSLLDLLAAAVAGAAK